MPWIAWVFASVVAGSVCGIFWPAVVKEFRNSTPTAVATTGITFELRICDPAAGGPLATVTVDGDRVVAEVRELDDDE
jgi:hypothetical protein